MNWIYLIIALFVGMSIVKFVTKTLFKIVFLVALGLGYLYLTGRLPMLF